MQTVEHEITIPATVADANMMATITKAEIDTQIATAKQYPRSIKLFMDTALQMVTLNEEVATSCNYALPRGKKIIEGPSARFAELIYSAWGNARAGARVVHEDTRFVTAQGICHDLQSNTMITFEVKRRVTDSHGKTYNDDMIGVTGNAAASIALRNAILKVIPKAFWQPLYAEARRVSMGDSKTLATRRADALSIMLKFGVTLEMVLDKFEIRGEEDIALEHLATLKACAISIRDGEATAESLFPVPKLKSDDAGKGTEALKDKMKLEAAKKAAAAGETINVETGEVTTVVAVAFDINNFKIATQAGTKEAITALAALLEPMASEERASAFMQAGGMQLVSTASRHGLGQLNQKFVALGINLPAQE